MDMSGQSQLPASSNSHIALTLFLLLTIAMLEYIRLSIQLSAMERILARLQRDADNLYAEHRRSQLEARVIERIVQNFTGGESTNLATTGGFPKVRSPEAYYPINPTTGEPVAAPPGGNVQYPP